MSAKGTGDRADDKEVLNAARAWWIRELTVENLCVTPKGQGAQRITARGRLAEAKVTQITD